MMKVLHLVASMDPVMGGVCQAIRTIINGLAALEVQNEVVSLDAADSPFLVNDNFVTHALGPGKSPWVYAPLLRTWLMQHAPEFDVVIVHGLWLYHGFAAYKVIQQLRKQSLSSKADQAPTVPKLFVMPHGMLDPYFQRAASRKLKAYRNTVYWALIEKHLINTADGILFTCEDECRLARQPFHPYNPKREFVVGLGVEKPPQYTPAMQRAFLKKCPALQNRPYLLFLSRIHEKKGVELLLQAYTQLQTKAANLAKPIPSSEVTAESSLALPALVIAGPGVETPFGQRMLHLAAQSAYSEHIFFPGMLAGEAKWGAFFGCEAFVLPSHQENFGIAVVEALGCAKPVLISNQVNIWEEIITAGGGLVAEDTVDGAMTVLAKWHSLLCEEKQQMAQCALGSFNTSFAMETTSEKLLAAITAN